MAGKRVRIAKRAILSNVSLARISKTTGATKGEARGTVRATARTARGGSRLDLSDLRSALSGGKYAGVPRTKKTVRRARRTTRRIRRDFRSAT